MKRKTRGALLTLVGLAAIATALMSTTARAPSLLVAFICFFLAATSLSAATGVKELLRPFVKKKVRIEVWGNPIPDASRPELEIDSIAAWGAGLLIHLKQTADGPRVLLKIAQPGAAEIREDGIEIRNAAYVSWGGRKLDRVTKLPALSLKTK